jgi:hypothetical protein
VFKDGVMPPGYPSLVHCVIMMNKNMEKCLFHSVPTEMAVDRGTLAPPFKVSEGGQCVNPGIKYIELPLTATADHNRQLLLSIAPAYGSHQPLLPNAIVNWSQYVVYNGGESGRHGVECGVPQGLVLGPLFFLLYVNDMVMATGELGFVLFADDTNLFAEGHNQFGLFERVNEGLAELGRWFRCSKSQKDRVCLSFSCI